MKRTIAGICIICVVLVAFFVAKPFLFGRTTENGCGVEESVVMSTQEPEVESVIASAVNPTAPPMTETEQSDASQSVTVAPTVIPTAEPTAKPTPKPTSEPTATPKVVEIPDPTKVPVPTTTATPKPVETEEPKDNSAISDEDISYVAELLEIP